VFLAGIKSSPRNWLASKSLMLVRSRAKPVAIIGALVLMIAAILYVALNRNHAVAPEPPLHQSR
jgi:hypothetical protein